VAHLLEIRAALQNTLSGLQDFPVFHYVADSAPPPCAWIEPENIDYLQVMASDSGEYEMVVTVLTGRVNEAQAQDQLDRYLSPDGPDSIPLIVDRDPTLGGVVDYCVAVSMDRYGTFQVGGVEYIGAQIVFEVRL
jgi:hypothetical protein